MRNSRNSEQQMDMNSETKTILTRAVSFFLAVVLYGCGSSNVMREELIWPSPPDEPRIKYIKTYDSEDIYTSGIGKVAEALAGKEGVMRLLRPFDVCVENERVYVTDLEQGLVVFDDREEEVEPLGERSVYPLIRVLGLACGNRKVFVGEVKLGQIIVLTPEGGSLYAIGAPGQFLNPVDVAYDPKHRRVIVVDNKRHQVFVYSENGDSLFTIGERGAGDGEFNFPQSAAVDTAGNIYIVDAFNFRIQVFDRDGKYLRKYGEQGSVFGRFDRPKGIALDSYGNIYVVDAVHNNFQIFSNNFDFLMFVGRYAPDRSNLGFENPIGIHITPDNTIFVVDQLNSRVQRFQLLKGD